MAEDLKDEREALVKLKEREFEQSQVLGKYIMEQGNLMIDRSRPTMDQAGGSHYLKLRDIIEVERTKHNELLSQVIQATAQLALVEIQERTNVVLDEIERHGKATREFSDAITQNTSAMKESSDEIKANTDRTEKAVLAGERTAKSVNRLTWILGVMTLLILVGTAMIVYYTKVLVDHETKPVPPPTNGKAPG